MRRFSGISALSGCLGLEAVLVLTPLAWLNEGERVMLANSSRPDKLPEPSCLLGTSRE